MFKRMAKIFDEKVSENRRFPFENFFECFAFHFGALIFHFFQMCPTNITRRLVGIIPQSIGTIIYERNKSLTIVDKFDHLK